MNISAIDFVFVAVAFTLFGFGLANFLQYVGEYSLKNER